MHWPHFQSGEKGILKWGWNIVLLFHWQPPTIMLHSEINRESSTIVRTVCFFFYQIIRSRLFPNKAALLPVWNSFPGALVALPHYSRDPKDFPFYHINFETSSEKFTAIIHTTTTVVRDSTSLFRLIKSVGQSSFVSKVKLNSWCQYQIPVCILPCPSSGLSEEMMTSECQFLLLTCLVFGIGNKLLVLFCCRLWSCGCQMLPYLITKDGLKFQFP